MQVTYLKEWATHHLIAFSSCMGPGVEGDMSRNTLNISQRLHAEFVLRDLDYGVHARSRPS